MKRLIFYLSALLAVNFSCHAAAGMADRFTDYQHWVLPAYLYCLAFGLCAFALSVIVYFRYRIPIDLQLDKFSRTLVRNKWYGILLSGILLSVPIAIIITGLWLWLWILAFVPVYIVSISLPALLSNRQLRSKLFLSATALKWEISLFMSMIIACALFAVLTSFHILPGTDLTLMELCGISNDSEFRLGSCYLTHPFDSLKDILYPVCLIIADSIISIVIVLFGELLRKFGIKITPGNTSVPTT